MPRLLGVSAPPGQSFGRPRDVERQRAILRTMLGMLETATAPGAYAEMPGEWPQTPAQSRNESRDLPPSPIAALLQKKPWLVPLLYTGRIPRPEEERAADAEHLGSEGSALHR